MTLILEEPEEADVERGVHGREGRKQRAVRSRWEMRMRKSRDSTHGGSCRPLDFESESKGDDKPLESWYPFSSKKKKRLVCFKFLFLIFTYLAPSLWHTGSHMGSLVVQMGSVVAGCPTACEVLVPRPGIKLASSALEGEVLTTGPPGTSPHFIISSDVTFSLRPTRRALF